MFFEGNFNKIGQVDSNALADYLVKTPEDVWYEHAERQKVYKAHEKTQMIPLVFDADFRHSQPTIHKELESVVSLLEPAMKIITQHFELKVVEDKNHKFKVANIKKAYFARILIVRLFADSEITPHVDHGYSLSRAHRIHWSIITNSGVTFTIDNQTKCFSQGELWEVNNRRTHSVNNLGKSPRYHVIFDFVIPNERVVDPLLGNIRC